MSREETHRHDLNSTGWPQYNQPKIPEKRKTDIENYLAFKFSERNKPKGGVRYNKMAYIEEIDKFDYEYFRLSPKEARLMDPNQRILLETACAAIDDAGQKKEMLRGNKIGLYVAYSSVLSAAISYQNMIQETDAKSVNSSIPGNMRGIAPGRISYLFDFKGPSMLIDTTCSSSLAAVHLACRAIRNGDCDQAIVGATKITLLPLDGEIKVDFKDTKLGREEIRQLHFRESLLTIWQVIQKDNLLIDQEKPWELAKDEQNKPKLEALLKELVFDLYNIAVALKPFMPQKSQEIIDVITAKKIIKPQSPIFPRLNK